MRVRPTSRTGALALGVDYGTESGRVLLLDLDSGDELACSLVPYAHGVLDTELPGTNEPLPHDWALQHPADYLAVLRRGVPAALRDAGVDARRIVGIGLDFTSCTVLPARRDGTPLALLQQWAGRPHAWTKLWKHHAAQPLATRLTDVALERDESFLARYGGRISSEWYFPKLGQIAQEDPEVYAATDVFVEAGDWVVWQLCGTLVRSACAAGYKAFWSAEDGLPSAQYFAAALPELGDPAAKLGSQFAPLGAAAGTLSASWATELGLGENVAVAVANVDSFVSVPACGVTDPGVFVTVVGTSICDMLVDTRAVLLPGITGVVRDGILPHSYGYEAGQPAVGDMFAWFVERLAAGATADTNPYGALEAAAGALRPGQSGVVALDWFNGNRSILADADLSGVLVGLTLQTTPQEIYRALLESVAFGARAIVDNFDGHGLTVSRIVACGGVAEKSALSMTLLADVTGREVELAGSPQVPARGSALFAAVAAGVYPSILEAARSLTPAPAATFKPDPARHDLYGRLYGIYRFLHDTLGRDHPEVLRELKSIRTSA